MSEDGQDKDKNNFIEFIPEFKNNKNCQPCSMIELISLFKNDEKNNVKTFNDNNVVKATKDYVYAFNKYGISENITQIAYSTRRLFADEEFTTIEQTFLVDLVPSTVEEAFALIPSLKSKVSPEKMQELLDKLNNEIIIN